ASVRGYHRHAAEQAHAARERQALATSRKIFEKEGRPGEAFDALIEARDNALTTESRKLLDRWPKTVQQYSGEEHVVKVRDKEIHPALKSEPLSGSRIPKVALPRFEDEGEILRFLMRETLPGHFPFTAGVFPFKRENEDPTRMFAGEGDPFRTNRRFKKISEGMPAQPLSTALRSVTLSRFPPAPRPPLSAHD